MSGLVVSLMAGKVLADGPVVACDYVRTCVDGGQLLVNAVVHNLFIF